MIDTEDGINLTTQIGGEYTITISGYPDNTSYDFSLDGGTTIGIDPLFNGSTEFTYTFTATQTQTLFIIATMGPSTFGDYTLTFGAITASPLVPSQGDDIGVGTAKRDVVRLINGNDVYDALGGNGNGYMAGGLGNDTMNASAGADRGRGHGGDDTIDGGAGNDRFFGDAGDDTMNGGDDDDLLVGGTGNDNLFGQNGADTIYSGDGDDSLNGGNQDDLLYGGNDADSIRAGIGNDVIEAGEGDDWAQGFRGDDIIDLGAGDDRARGGGTGNDRVFGDAGSDLLVGGADNDFLSGGSGSDDLIGGTGDDRMAGGTGADTFVFVTGHGADVITDFDTSEDVLDFSGILIPYDPEFDGIFPVSPSIEYYSEYASQEGANVVLTIDGGDRVTLLNTDLGDLSADNFILPEVPSIPETFGESAIHTTTKGARNIFAPLVVCVGWVLTHQWTTESSGRGLLAATIRSPTTSPSGPASTDTSDPSSTSPARIISASGSWIAR